jgi:hypothetical protein
MKHKILLSFLVAALCSTGVAWAQQRTITGKVMDGEDNSPLPGATVVVKGAGKGTVTDVDGKFTIEAVTNDVLIISFIGYSTKQVTVGTSSVIDVQLSAEVQALQEIVVVGYGT